MNSESTEAALPAAVAKIIGWRRTTVVVSALMLGWFVLVAVLGGGLALRMAGLPVLGDAEPTFWDRPMLDGAAVVFAVCLGATLAARWLRPAATLPISLGVAVVIVLGGAATTASLGALLTAVAMLAISWLLGYAVVTRLGRPDVPGWIGAVVSIALGNGLLGLLLLLLVSMRSLNTASVTASALVLVLGIAALASRRPMSIARGSWNPPVLRWFETVLLGITCALVAFAMLSALAPEHASDAVRLHLPIAREIWQEGAAPYYPEFWPTGYPIHAQLLYAPVWGFGGMVGVKLVHTMIGLTTVMAVAGLGWMLAGRLAAVTAAAIFAALPVVLWQLGHAYVDLSPALFIAAATLATMIWQRDGSRTWLVVCGALAAFAVAAKMTSGPYPVALALVIVLVGRERWRLWDRVLDVLAFAVGSVVLLPWLLRSYVVSGVIPGIDLLADALSGDPYEFGSNLGGFGVGRNPLDVLRIPWDATFNGGAYMENGSGGLGIALLLTLPLITLVPRTRGAALVLGLAAFGFLGWAYTAQYFRYGLPLFAWVAALCGAGISGAVTPGLSFGRMPARVVPLLLAGSLALTPLLWLPVWGNQVPVGLFTGSMTQEEYLSGWVHGHAMLVKAGELLPADTPVGWVSSVDAAQIYSEARMYRLTVPSLGSSPQEILDSLASQQISHFVWDRPRTPAEYWREGLLSTAFLRAHTRILGASDGAYLFEIVDEPGDRWELDAENLLLDSGLREVGEGGEGGAWQWILSREPVAPGFALSALAGGDAVSQMVPITEAGPYLFSVEASCETPDAPLNLSLRWLDDHGAVLALTWELVVPGSQPSERFIWAEAPLQATRVQVGIAGWGDSACVVSEASLLGPDH